MIPNLQELELTLYDKKIEVKELKKDLKLLKEFLSTSDKVERVNDLDNKVRETNLEIKVLKE